MVLLFSELLCPVRVVGPSSAPPPWIPLLFFLLCSYKVIDNIRGRGQQCHHFLSALDVCFYGFGLMLMVPTQEAGFPSLLESFCNFTRRRILTFFRLSIPICRHTHTNRLWICRSLDPALQRNKYIMDSTGKLPYAVLARRKSGSGARICPIDFRAKQVCLKVSSKASILAQAVPLTL